MERGSVVIIGNNTQKPRTLIQVCAVFVLSAMLTKMSGYFFVYGAVFVLHKTAIGGKVCCYASKAATLFQFTTFHHAFM
jgi:hypothetical protein